VLLQAERAKGRYWFDPQTKQLVRLDLELTLVGAIWMTESVFLGPTRRELKQQRSITLRVLDSKPSDD
jgi:hypothetical protein